MSDDADPFVFPEMPDEAVIAIDQFLDVLPPLPKSLLAQLHRWYHALDEREAYHDPMPSPPLKDPPF